MQYLTVWGDTMIAQKTIICDGCGFQVTDNLYNALRRFQFNDIPRIVWADAVCINQQSVEEKNTQVPLMKYIYRKAINVLIWLGEEDKMVVRNVFTTLSRYVRQKYPSFFPEAFAYFWWNDEQVTNLDDATYAFDPDVGTVLPLHILCSAPWFGRGWVVQEAALCSQAYIYWGCGRLDFDVIGWAANLVNESFGTNLADHDGIRRLLFIFVMRLSENSGKEPSITFFSLLKMTEGFAFRERKDRVYGLLGLRTLDWNPSDGQPFVSPDYGTNAMDCFRKVAERFLFELRDLDILRLVQHGSDLMEDWPFWVPVLDKKMEGSFSRITNRIGPPTALGIVSREVKDAHDCICLPGFIVDKIDRHVHQYSATDDLPWNIDRLKNIQSLLRELERSYHATYLACTFGYVAEEHPRPPTCVAALTEDLRAFMQWSPPEDSLRNPIEGVQSFLGRYADAPERAAASFWDAISRGSHRTILFKTAMGMLGIGPLSMRPDDILVHLLGLTTPFIFRPVDGLWRLVGACYVYDVIQGDVIEEWEKRGKPIEDFYIY